ncbi:hypothetical protein APSETT444_006195 [Aspergillus pseudonomiae]
MRAHFEPEFSHLASVNMTDTFAMEIEKWALELSKGRGIHQQEATLGSFHGNPTEACRYLPFRLTGLTVYGDALDAEVMLDAFFGRFTVSKIFNILPTQSRRRLDTFKATWEKLNLDIIAKARTFLETMDELLFTNIDVTSTVLAFLLINIAANQSFQSSLREEITAKQSQPSYNLGEYVLEKDTLLHYAAMESVRMSPALCYRIPAQTPAVIDWKRLNTTPAIWGSDGERFRPERFADISPMAYRYGLLRFGIGRGRCLGKNIADMMLKMVTVAIVQRYFMTPAGKEKGTRQDRFTVTSEEEIEFTPIRPLTACA